MAVAETAGAPRRGLYVLANDRVLDHAVALLASVRRFDPGVEILCIPYDDESAHAAALLERLFAVRPYPHLDVLARIDRAARDRFPARMLRRPHNLRKLACWFGPFDEFLYLDCDIVVFEAIAALLDHLAGRDFLCCDDQHRGGLAHVFAPSMRDAGLFGEDTLGDVFNAGLWGSRRGALPDTVDALLGDCARHAAHLDFSRGGTCQPILNYLVLRHCRARINVFRDLPGEPRMWAGTPGLRRRGATLTDPAVGRRLRFLHWAGLPIGPGHPYWSTWKHYRFLHPRAPRARSALVAGLPPWRRLARAARRALRRPAQRASTAS